MEKKIMKYAVLQKDHTYYLLLEDGGSAVAYEDYGRYITTIGSGQLYHNMGNLSSFPLGFYGENKSWGYSDELDDIMDSLANKLASINHMGSSFITIKVPLELSDSAIKNFLIESEYNLAEDEDEGYYDLDGFDEDGYDRDGYDADGYDENGEDRDGNYRDDDEEEEEEYEEDGNGETTDWWGVPQPVQIIPGDPHITDVPQPVAGRIVRPEDVAYPEIVQVTNELVGDQVVTYPVGEPGVVWYDVETAEPIRETGAGILEYLRQEPEPNNTEEELHW